MCYLFLAFVQQIQGLQRGWPVELWINFLTWACSWSITLTSATPNWSFRLGCGGRNHNMHECAWGAGTWQCHTQYAWFSLVSIRSSILVFSVFAETQSRHPPAQGSSSSPSPTLCCLILQNSPPDSARKNPALAWVPCQNETWETG